MKKILIAVAWPYVNGDLHIGHLAGYLFPADISARFHRLLGNDVAMVSGSDCFGTPTTIEADKRGLAPKDIVREYHEKNLELFKIVGISFDLFTKTDTENHKAVAQDVFVKMAESGYITKDTSEQYYSESESRFLPDRYVEGTCPNCGFTEARSDQCDKCGTLLNQGELKNPKSKMTNSPVSLKKTEHYFVDWPKLQPFLEKYIAQKSHLWKPWVREETNGWLKKGLKPRAITRDLDWGVEIPIDRLPEDLQIEGAENKRIYVWFEAVLGYLSATIEWAKKENKDYKDFWYNKDAKQYYFVGKDNLVFHTLFLPGELHSYDAKINLPDFPAINQFLNLENQKFSKSRGVIVDSRYIVEKYGRDPVRFYLTSIMPENTDANFSWEDFVKTNNGVLIGNLGNFINRVLTLCEGLEKTKVSSEIKKIVEEKITNMRDSLESCEFKKCLEHLLHLSDYGNKYIASEEPWALKKKNENRFHEVMTNALYLTLALFITMQPLLVDAAEKLKKMLGIEESIWPEGKKIDETLTSLMKKVKIEKLTPLFQRIDESVIEEERVKLGVKK